MLKIKIYAKFMLQSKIYVNFCVGQSKMVLLMSLLFKNVIEDVVHTKFEQLQQQEKSKANMKSDSQQPIKGQLYE